MRSAIKPENALRLIDLLSYNVAHQPDKLAFRVDDEAMTYRQLDQQVKELQHRLAEIVLPGDRVGIWLPNGAAWITAFFALNAMGAISIPLNTRLTATETVGILKDGKAKVVVASNAYRGRNYTDEIHDEAAQQQLGLTVITASQGRPAADWAVSCSQKRAAPEVAAHLADGLLCIQYTSGTTAKPKGVMLTEASYLATAAYVARCQLLTPNSRFFSAAPFFHCSGSMHAITTCFYAGCTLTSMSAWDPELFAELVSRHGCDTGHMIYFRDVLELPRSVTRDKLSSLNVAHDLGPRDYLLTIHDELGVPGISNLYGMTETSGQYTMWFPDDPLEQRVSGNGRPQPGNFIRIVDPDGGRTLNPGEAGEIQMAGHTITPGYFERQEANALAFTSDGWFRSGDIGSLSEHGILTYIDRAKDIIRVGGENFSPAEVEQAMREHCGLHQVCVLGIPDKRLDEVSAAVVVIDAPIDWKSIQTTLRQKLAGYKVPNAIYIASHFPITSTNKVQRKTLKKWIAEGRLSQVI